MGSNGGRTTKLSLVPLPKGSVLLPGATLRIPVSNRPDLANLLSSLLDRTQAAKRDANSITFGCVPLCSPYLSKDGQHVIGNGAVDGDKGEDFESFDAGQARKEDLYSYGTLGKVIGVQRRAYSEPHLLVQGVQRMTVKRVLKERPFFEAECTLHDEKGLSCSFSLHMDPSYLLAYRAVFERSRDHGAVPATKATISGASCCAAVHIDDAKRRRAPLVAYHRSEVRIDYYKV